MDKIAGGSRTAPSPVNGRRGFLNTIWTFIGSLLCLELGWVSLSMLRSGKDARQHDNAEVIINAGTIEDFAVNSVTAIPKGQFYLIRLADGTFLALSRTCTHLGCSLVWDEEAHKFICPCHGSSFAITGEVLTPPATRPLNLHPLRIENGAILVNTARTEQPLDNGRSRPISG